MAAAAASGCLEMASPFPAQPGTLRLLEAPDTPRQTLIERLLGDRYDKPFVLDDGDLRLLLFRLDYIQSAMRLADPFALDLAYTRRMMSFVLFHTNVRLLLLIGLGGGSLAKFCYRHLPQARLTAVEADRHVIAWRDQFCLPADDARFAVVHADGADFVAGSRLRPDVVLVDAFDRDGFAPSLSTPTFYADLRARLPENGILVVNLTGDTGNRRAQFELIRTAFSDNLLLIPVEDGFNHVVFAFRNARFEPRWKWIGSQAAAMRARFGLNFPKYAAALARSRRGEPAW